MLFFNSRSIPLPSALRQAPDFLGHAHSRGVSEVEINSPVTSHSSASKPPLISSAGLSGTISLPRCLAMARQ
ncbi:hypothetical protein CLOP_g23021 [Closterium sp. NIES-67]|nr:hypothetical protein CLOP_g23021 [Closterium sp. NIES-67]